MNNLQSLLIGIVSGIVTSALIYLTITIFKKIVIPWYQEIVYQGVNIGGEWRFASERGVRQETVVNLSQHAHRLTGTATVINQKEAPHPIDLIRVFKLQGTISNRFVVLNLQHSEKNRIGLATVLLEVVGDGRRMIGCWTFYEVIQNKIYSVECTLNRLDDSYNKIAGSENTQSNKPLESTPS